MIFVIPYAFSSVIKQLEAEQVREWRHSFDVVDLLKFLKNEKITLGQGFSNFYDSNFKIMLKNFTTPSSSKFSQTRF